MNLAGGVGDKFRQRSESSRSIFIEVGGAVLVATWAGCGMRPWAWGLSGDRLELARWALTKKRGREVRTKCVVEIPESDVEKWVPLSVREARRARARREDLWPYVWMNFVSMILLFGAVAIACYRMGAQSCR